MQETKPVPHVHAEIIKAWADGHVIEFRDDEWNSWKLLSTKAPAWQAHLQYRVKPTPKPDVVYFMALGRPSYVADTGRSTIEGFASDLHEPSLDSLKLTFDGDTGKLKKAEVL